MLTVFRRHALLAILSFAYLLMSLLVVQQAHTIDSQRTLIRQLFQDSAELTTMKLSKIQQERH
ncbi:MAG: hypothetical protein ACR2IF_07805 [Terriglobales bacterium]